MKHTQQDAFRELAVDIEKELSHKSHLVTALFAKKIITDQEVESIQAGERSLDKTRRLVEIITRKDHKEYDVFDEFCKALEEDEQKPLAMKLKTKLEEIEKRDRYPGPSLQTSNPRLLNRPLDDKGAASSSNAPPAKRRRLKKEDEEVARPVQVSKEDCNLQSCM